jgi:hypothetical protein
VSEPPKELVVAFMLDRMYMAETFDQHSHTRCLRRLDLGVCRRRARHDGPHVIFDWMLRPMTIWNDHWRLDVWKYYHAIK